MQNTRNRVSSFFVNLSPLNLAICSTVFVKFFCFVCDFSVCVDDFHRKNIRQGCRTVELPHSESRTSRASDQSVPPLIFLQALHETRQGESATPGGEIHQSEVGVDKKKKKII